MIEVQGLRKRIGNVQALDGLSFRAEDGQITGLLGPNGAGKTTALRTLFGLLKADEGRALVNGLDVQSNTVEAKRQLGLFPDPFGLYERLTPREYIHYFATVNGLSKAEARRATDEVLAQMQMQEIADRRCKGFSQGQRMKTALAQAIVHRPNNIILDEPSRGLDVMSTRILRQTLSDLRDQGHCVLFSSHVMQEVAALCDQVIIIAKGKLVAQGSPQELCRITGQTSLEEAFIQLIGTDEGIAA
ncbi:ATP-binding cassette domain-containing protein [Ferrimonas sediminicola]|uniref:ATP-binding cassette domain-containing protein n=1 Tax=Ferrimonas sediminicola TaxID=2569538 RepID=A0A4V6WMM8_9GAMM|nr:ATP-binding cassette domain-containing protein [Ferrimonas sediminicola]TKB48129.1 ATP-binding cassette domain-containing protein [Ferrimonas sediminicola]